MWDLIVSVPDHCLSFYFVIRFINCKIHVIIFYLCLRVCIDLRETG